jgi:type II secretory pathway pseudopilin PulG
MKRNEGISLITLIITIIVIIILAAIVIFTGLRTPDSAQFSAFTNDVDTVYTRMIDKFADLKVDHSVSGDYRTNEQIYIELATGVDNGQYVVMATNTIPSVTSGTSSITGESKYCQRIDDGTNLYERTGYNTLTEKTKFLGKDGFKLPKVREQTDSWYVTADGRIFNATGFSYNGKVYWNASYYTEDSNNTLDTVNHIGRAEAIASAMESGTTFNVSAAGNS